MMNIRNSNANPAANSFQEPLKTGTLLKRTKRWLIKPGAWQKRYCVLHGTKLYIYENKESNGHGKQCSTINLRYYDKCSTAENKEKQNNESIFIIQQSEKLGFFDVKHIFCTESKDDRNEWISNITGIISQISKKTEQQKDGGKRHSMTFDKLIPQAERLNPVTKDRAKGPKGRRLPNRKSEFPQNSDSTDRLERKTASEILSVPETTDAVQNIQFMDVAAEGKPQEVTGSSENVQTSDSPSQEERPSSIIPKEANDSTSGKMGSDGAQKLMKELEDKWEVEAKDDQKECEDGENEKMGMPRTKGTQLRQLSVTSNVSTNSDRASTYQFYNLEKDIKSLKRDVTSLQVFKNTNKNIQTTVDKLEMTATELKNDVKDIKMAINVLAEKIQNMEQAIKYEESEEPETEEDTLI